MRAGGFAAPGSGGSERRQPPGISYAHGDAVTLADPGLSGGEDAEFAALRIGQHRPASVALADVGRLSPGLAQPAHLSGLIVARVGRDIQMDPVLGHLGARDLQQLEIGPDAPR